MQRRDLVIAIDGPSGSGKSTVARTVASALQLRYLDTGAMYRAVTWLVLERAVDLGDVEAVAAVATSARLDLTLDVSSARVLANGTDVTSAIRGPDVTAAVSAVSAVPEVRSELVRRQRDIIGEGGIVVEGRDIGTTVVPFAPVKVYLTADAETRARRRTRQDGATVAAAAIASTQADLARRDAADSGRAASPLTLAPDAVEIDSSALGIDQVVAVIVELAEEVLDA